MKAQTLVLSIALALIADAAYARRPVVNRPSEQRAETPAERQAREARERANGIRPNAVDNATSRQQRTNEVSRELELNRSLDRQDLSNGRMIDNQVALNSLASKFPQSKVPEIVTSLVDLQVQLARANNGGTLLTSKRFVVDRAMQTMNSLAEQVYKNPKFETPAVRKEITETLDIIKTEVVDAAKGETWANHQLLNMESWLVAVNRGLQEGLSPSEATNRHGKFSWAELLRRCNKKA